LLTQHIGIALVSVILAGSTLGFLRYNFHPASIFLGDSGSYFLGFMISILSLMSSQKGPAAVAVLVPIIALGLPIMDTAFSMFRRLLKSLHILEVDRERNLIRFLFFHGWSMFKADKEHFHHKLLQTGFTQKKAVVFLYAISIVLGALALSSLYFRNINHALLISTIAIGSFIGIRKLGYSEVQVLSNGTLLPFFNTPVINRRLLRVFVDMGLISLSYYLAFILRFEGAFSSYTKYYYLSTLPMVLATRITAFYFSGLYKGSWRYAGVPDVLTMIKGVVLGCIASAVLLRIIPDFGIHSRALLLIDFNLLLLFIIGARSSFRILEQFQLAKNHRGRRVLIYGAGKRGVYAAKEFISNPRLDLSPIGFIDENPRYQGKRIIGFPVLGDFDSLEGILAKNSISEVILCREDLSKEKVKRLAEICSSYNIPLRHYKTHLEEIPTPVKGER
jgi:UDP-GlcNAc:undecaprenyl-phosphate GlcNAc-1-phosphate transferase